MSITTEIASTLLGKKVSGSETYDPSILVAVPRYENREQYNIDPNNLPFVGYDIWHGYEFSTMTTTGIPVTRVIKLKYDCSSEYIVESKSLKLYLNSYNMDRYGNTVKECLDICKNQIERDLSKLLKTEVVLNFFGSDCSPVFEPFESFKNLVDFVDEDTYQTDTFKETPSLLKLDAATDSYKSYFLKFDALRSRCRITSQPDWGDILISYTSKKHIDEESLMKYLTSFRGENHFHEEITECCYKRLYDLLDIEHDEDAALFVSALYTRRGGIDINPVRASNSSILELAGNLGNIDVFTRSTLKQ